MKVMSSKYSKINHFIEVETENYEKFMTKNMELCKGLLVFPEKSLGDWKAQEI